MMGTMGREGHSHIEFGARIGDFMMIRPFSGHKRRVTLNRNCYQIQAQKGHFTRVEGVEIDLPSVSIGGNYQISLASEREITSRFILEATGLWPFKINGTYSYKSPLLRGDAIDIDYNRIEIVSNETIKNRRIKEVEHLSENSMKSQLNVLIEGETGTGKTRCAHLIHDKSGRLGRFVHLNLSAFSANLLESEIFGHVRGAFTGAVCDKKGAIREANQGTLFLDEVDSLPLEIQTKLLLFLDNKKVRPVGDGRDYQCDTRLIFASGRRLKNLCEMGKMRRDFYFRLAQGIKMHLQPLRERGELIDEILNDFCARENVIVSQTLRSFYKKQNWEGNIRQFLGHLDTKKIMSESRVWNFCVLDRELESTPLEAESTCFERERILPVNEVKMRYIYNVFQKLNQKTNITCELLKISKSSLRRAVQNIEEVGA